MAWLSLSASSLSSLLLRSQSLFREAAPGFFPLSNVCLSGTMWRI
uniref:Uncharacterized protein n=1 Tax=Anguilla anguilla TaxID=7936 RepID=A0A0E9VBC2_ANGAN